MHFLVTAYDGVDNDSSLRRYNARERHLDGVKTKIKEGSHLFGAAILNEQGDMIGSVMIVDYPSIEMLHSEWLNSEPYVLDNVWERIDIQPCRVPDFFCPATK